MAVVRSERIVMGAFVTVLFALCNCHRATSRSLAEIGVEHWLARPDSIAHARGFGREDLPCRIALAPLIPLLNCVLLGG